MINDIIEIGFAAVPALAGGAAWKIMSNRSEKKRIAEYAPKIIDGKTENEWYELIRDMGKEDFERLTAGVIDLKEDENGEYSLERNPEYGWDTKKVMGERNYNRLMREWYPERFCKFCNEQCHDKCWSAQEARAAREQKDLMRKAIAAKQERHETQWAKVKEVAKTQPDPKRGTYFTQIRYLGTGLAGWRITHNGAETMLSKVDVKKYQQKHGLLMDGIIGAKTQGHMRRQLTMGFTLNEPDSGALWDYFPVKGRPGIVKVTYTAGKNKVTEEVLESSLPDMMPLVKEKLRRKLNYTQNLIVKPGQKKPTTMWDELERTMREQERRLNEINADLEWQIQGYRSKAEWRKDTYDFGYDDHLFDPQYKKGYYLD